MVCWQIWMAGFLIPDVPLFSAALSVFDFTAMPEEEEWKDPKARWGDLELEEQIVHFGAAKIAPGGGGKVTSCSAASSTRRRNAKYGPYLQIQKYLRPYFAVFTV